MPKDSTACFYGAFQLGNNRDYSVLLTQPISHPSANDNPSSDTVSLLVQIFEIRGSETKLINTVPVVYRSPVGPGLDLVRADLLWLDPSLKTEPILKLYRCSTSCYFGECGDEVLVIFPHGIGADPRSQSFSNGASSAGGQSTTFDHLDGQGRLEVRCTVYYDSADDPPMTWLLDWNGDQFVTVNDPAPGPGGMKRRPW